MDIKDNKIFYLNNEGKKTVMDFSEHSDRILLNNNEEISNLIKQAIRLKKEEDDYDTLSDEQKLADYLMDTTLGNKNFVYSKESWDNDKNSDRFLEKARAMLKHNKLNILFEILKMGTR